MCLWLAALLASAVSSTTGFSTMAAGTVVVGAPVFIAPWGGGGGVRGTEGVQIAPNQG